MGRRANPLESVPVKKPDRAKADRVARVEGKKNWDDQRKYPHDRPGPLGRRGK